VWRHLLKYSIPFIFFLFLLDLFNGRLCVYIHIDVGHLVCVTTATRTRRCGRKEPNYWRPSSLNWVRPRPSAGPKMSPRGSYRPPPILSKMVV
jgi:hypothetical protein